MEDINKYKNFTTLYVEDNEQIRRQTIYILKKFFNSVYEAKDGNSGLELYKKYKPNIVLTDIHMPELGGMEMVKVIRQNDKNTKIIVLSAYSDKKFLFDAIEFGVVSYIEKPLNIDLLLKAFDKSLFQMQEVLIELNDEFSFDLSKHLLFKNKEIIKITQKEIHILFILCSNKNSIVSYEEIQNYVWKNSFVSGSTLRTTIKSLRKKLPLNSLQNISGVGYKIVTKEYF